MNVLVTGGAGYIGDVVVQELFARGHSVTVVDKLMYTDSYMRQGVRFKNMDILSESFLDFLKQEKFDTIIHLAAIVGDAACTVDPSLTVETNESVVGRIVGYIKDHAPNTRLLFSSTCSVYGDNMELLNEESETRPLSLYAGTKLRAEQIIEESGIKNYLIFRLGTLFGLSTPFGRIRADLVANILTFRACENKDITVFGGEQWRPMIHVKDVGRAFALLSLASYSGKVILSHENHRISEIGDKIMEIINPQSNLIVTDAKFEDLRNYKVSKVRQMNLGFLTRYNLSDGIREMSEAFKQGRIKNPWITQYHNGKFLKETLDVR